LSDELAAVLRQLRQQYLDESPHRLAELEAQLALVAGGDSSALVGLADILHRLAGSGGSYGLADVTTAARAGEKFALSLRDASAAPDPGAISRLREHIAAVAAAFEAGRKQPPPEHF
jgi:chemotaxis protein histidine kinase CheA